ncbi:MAG: tyrosine--tRNA ligase [Candidatus Coatesbacteria bacterium]
MAGLHSITIDEELAILRRGVAHEIPKDSLREKLELSRREKRPMRIKFGVDPSAPDLHLGHTVPLRKLRQFQELGHTVIFLIGDFTARIGDPTGVSVTRPQLNEAQVKAYAQTYLDQVWRVLDQAKTEVRYNSEWAGKMTFADVIRLAGKYTVAQILERDDFAKRYGEKKPIGVHEFLYPLVQGYDSVALRDDIEMCSTDQIFNCHVGRVLQQDAGMPGQSILAMPLIEGTDGVAKMSKSKGNAIGITEKPEDMYGKVLSLPDVLIEKFALLLLDEPLPAGLTPRDAKHALAKALVTAYHGAAAAEAAATGFDKVFVKHQVPDDAPEFRLAPGLVKDGRAWVVRLLTETGLAPSKNEANRLVDQRAVEVDGTLVTDPKSDVPVHDGSILKVGKRRFARLRVPED